MPQKQEHKCHSNHDQSHDYKEARTKGLRDDLRANEVANYLRRHVKNPEHTKVKSLGSFSCAQGHVLTLGHEDDGLPATCYDLANEEYGDDHVPLHEEAVVLASTVLDSVSSPEGQYL